MKEVNEETLQRLVKAAQILFGSLEHAESVAACAVCVENIHALHNGPENHQTTGPQSH